MAIGHSARDTVEMLYDLGIETVSYTHLSASLLDKNCCGRCLCYESERTVIINRDNNGNDKAGVILSPLVKLLSLIHI